MSSSVHWTYEEFDPKDDLRQGDIILPDKEMLSVLEEAHPYFTNTKYTAFLVLTQTCDLARRGKEVPPVKYLNIAVIRPIKDVLKKMFDISCNPLELGKKPISGIYSVSSKYKAKQLIIRILNQNEQKLGLFYLYPHTLAGIPVHSVALLQVNITLKATHYNTLVKHRRGRLTAEFQSRLGWLAGNMYSRVAVQEWKKKDSTKLCKEVLELGSLGTKPIDWIPDAKFKKASKEVELSEGMSHLDILGKIYELSSEPPINKATRHIEKAITGVKIDISPNDVTKILQRLKNNSDFLSLLKK